MSRRMYGALQIAQRHPSQFAAITSPEPDTRRPVTRIVPSLAQRIEWCACFAGWCGCDQVVDGRTPTGAHCKAHAAASLQEDVR